MNINLNSAPFTTPCENGSGLQCKHNLIALQVVKILVTAQKIIRTLNRFHYSFTSIVFLLSMFMTQISMEEILLNK